MQIFSSQLLVFFETINLKTANEVALSELVDPK